MENNISTNTAMVAGGCFWCVASDFDSLPGVLQVVSGYAGGTEEYPTYENYMNSGHKEVVEITYNPKIISFEQIVTFAIKHMDPTDPGGSFGDRGTQYAPALYYKNESEKCCIETILSTIEKQGVYDKPLQVLVLPYPQFWPAEDYHQQYHKGIHALQYKMYRKASGRDAFIDTHWSNNRSTKLSLETTNEHSVDSLSPMQYKVTQKGGTEPPFKNEYHDNTRDGIYVDVLSGVVLFTSLDKFDSGTGWPSFTKPAQPDAIYTKKDNSLFMTRNEVKSQSSDAHLGHVFSDGPSDTGGLRYCMNSAALKFIAKEDLKQEGYAKYEILFNVNSDSSQ